MWILFDLDDTLIDTSGTLTPFRVEKALQKLVAEGLKIPDFAKARFQIFSLIKKTASTEEAFKLFFAFLGLDKSFIKIALQEIYDAPYPKNFPIKALPGATELLESLKDHRLFLVSKGHEKLQLQKLKKAGIDTQFFCKLFLSDNEDKTPHYQKILEEERALPEKVIVIGDRVKRDLLPAKKLGFWTIHMKWGRGLYFEGMDEYVDFAVTGLQEIPKILSQIEQGINV